MYYSIYQVLIQLLYRKYLDSSYNFSGAASQLDNHCGAIFTSLWCPGNRLGNDIMMCFCSTSAHADLCLHKSHSNGIFILTLCMILDTDCQNFPKFYGFKRERDRESLQWPLCSSCNAKGSVCSVQ